MFDKETDLDEINAPPRTRTATMTYYKQELRAITKAENTTLLNTG